MSFPRGYSFVFGCKTESRIIPRPRKTKAHFMVPQLLQTYELRPFRDDFLDLLDLPGVVLDSKKVEVCMSCWDFGSNRRIEIRYK